MSRSLKTGHPLGGDRCRYGYPPLFNLLWIVLLLGGCVPSTPPIHKVGLVAPFEGLHRQAGYRALDAMRQALAECNPTGRALLPVALDESLGREAAGRTLEKLQVDPAVAFALFAPGTAPMPDFARQLAPTVEGAMPVILPGLLQADGTFAQAADAQEALEHLLLAVEQAAARPSTREWQRILLLAPRFFPPDLLAGPLETALPIHRLDWPEGLLDPSGPTGQIAARDAALMDALSAQVAPGDVVFWLEYMPHQAELLTRIGNQFPSLSIIFGPHLGHLMAAQQVDLQPDFQLDWYWAVWTDDAYTEWAMSEIQTDTDRAQGFGSRKPFDQESLGQPDSVFPAVQRTSALYFVQETFIHNTFTQHDLTQEDGSSHAASSEAFNRHGYLVYRATCETLDRQFSGGVGSSADENRDSPYIDLLPLNWANHAVQSSGSENQSTTLRPLTHARTRP